MSLNLDDSGVFRVSKSETGSPAEVRVPQKQPPPGAGQKSPLPNAPTAQLSIENAPAASPVRISLGDRTSSPPASDKVALPSVDGDSAPRLNTANAPREVRVPIAPASPATRPPSGIAPPGITPAIQTEHRVTLPLPVRTTLRYSANCTRVSVSARKLEFPPSCPCCNRAADMTYDAVVEKKRDRQENKQWTFPYCGTCLRHVRQARWQRFAARGASVLVAALVACTGLLLNLLIPAVLVGAGVAAAGWFLGERLLFARLAVQPECVCYGPAAKFREYYATEQHFEFANRRYADAFTSLNERKLL